MGLNLEHARGQCYDGANVMSGHKNGVAKRIKDINPKCLYTHCYGHSLNLAVSDTVKGVSHLNNMFDMIKAICNLIKKSPKRERHSSTSSRRKPRVTKLKESIQCAQHDGLYAGSPAPQ